MRELSPQELDVARLISRGLTIEEIARATDLTYAQAKSVCRDLRRELNVARTRDVAFVLRELGVID